MKTKYIKRKYPKFYLLVAFTLLCFLAVGYSYINSDLGIEANALTASNKWNIEISNMQVNASSTYGSETNNSTGSQISFDLSLTNSNQSYIIDFDVTNNGTIVAYLKEISYNLTDYNNLDSYIQYLYTYNDGTEVQVNDVLNPNETVHMKLYINYLKKLPYEYNDNINSKTIQYGININYYFKGNQKNKVAIYENNTLTNKVYIPQSGEYVEIDSDDTYNFAICDGASAYEEDGKIQISYIPNITENPYCKLFTDLSEINNINVSDYPSINIYALKDYEFDGINNNLFYNGKANLYLNGKNINIQGKLSNDFSLYFETLHIINNTGNGVLNLYNKSISTTKLSFNGGTNNIIVSQNTAGIYTNYLYIDNATINIPNSNSDKVIYSKYNVNVVNSVINSNNTPLCILPVSNNATDVNVNILNSTINSDNSNILSIDNNGNNNLQTIKINICNSTFDYSSSFMDYLRGEIIYSNNSSFSTTNPQIDDMYSGSYVLKNDIACDIVNRMTKVMKNYIF